MNTSVEYDQNVEASNIYQLWVIFKKPIGCKVLEGGKAQGYLEVQKSSTFLGKHVAVDGCFMLVCFK